jgi:predicted nucleic acid-binding protein
MSRVLLDTDIFSEILKGKNETVKKHAAQYLAAEDKYTISAITVMEIVRRADCGLRNSAWISSGHREHGPLRVHSGWRLSAGA